MRTVIKLILLISVVPTIFLSACGGDISTTDRVSANASLSEIASLLKDDNVKKGNITGIVDSKLLSYMKCTGSRAVYIFQGHDASPDDIDKNDPNPVQSVSVVYDSVSRRYRYSAYSLTEGSYTLALTCQADKDSPLQDDNIRFGGIKNVTVSGGKDIIGHLFI